MNYKQITKNTYNRIASLVGLTYDEYFTNCVKQEADFFLKQLPNSAEILDIGCGVGTHSKYFQLKGFNTFGIDISEEMIKQCKLSGLNVECADFEELDFGEKLFDGIWAHTSLIHFPKNKWNELLAKISKLLIPGGRLFIAVREGTSEKFEIYKGDEELKRWFSDFQLSEIRDYLPNELMVERESRTEFRGKSFINIHIRKTKGRL